MIFNGKREKALTDAVAQARREVITCELDHGQTTGGVSFELLGTVRMNSPTLRTDEGNVDLYLSGGELELTIENAVIDKSSINNILDPELSTSFNASYESNSATIKKKSNKIEGNAKIAGKFTWKAPEIGGELSSKRNINTDFDQNNGLKTSYTLENFSFSCQPIDNKLIIYFSYPKTHSHYVSGKIYNDRICTIKTDTPIVDGEPSTTKVTANAGIRPRDLEIGTGTGIFENNLSRNKRVIVQRLINKLIEERWQIGNIDIRKGQFDD